MGRLSRGEYQFVDFGCSQGGSLKFGLERFRAANGLGLDRDPNKVAATQKAGFEALQMDVTRLGTFRDSVSFVLMFHFLEHLPGYRTALQCIKSGMTAARDFVLIKQPWFDSDGWLFSQGLKFYWADWRGHDYAMSQLDFYRALRDAGIPCRFRLYGRRPVTTTDDLAIHPASAPFDQHAYEKARHGDKPSVWIPTPTFYETQCAIMLSDRYSFADIEKHLDGGQNNVLYEGRV